MKNYVDKIIEGLSCIDDNSINMSLDEIKGIIENLALIAEKSQSKVWMIFLQSEWEYYNNNLDKSMELTLNAYNLDKEESKKNGQPLNYYILNSLAVSYYVARKYDEAIKCYLQVIDIKPDYYQAFLDLATVYRNIKKYKESSDYLDKIPDEKSNKEIYFQKIESKARLYIELQRYTDANNLLRGIEDEKKNDAEFLEALALSYIYLNDYKKAESIYTDALRLCQNKRLADYIKNKKEALDILNRTNTFDIASINMILELTDNEDEILGEVLRNMKAQQSLVQEYKSHYLKSKASRESWTNENFILCLKGWSSSTPEVSLGIGNEEVRNGGGFYIRYNNIGIVVDPGINFMENLHANNLFIQDINVVIVTHNHIDHNNDLGKILDMSYQLNTTIYYYIDTETYVRFQKPLEEVEAISPKYVRKIFLESPKKELILFPRTKKEIRMVYFKTEHNCPGAYGFKLEFKDKLILGYTSDTKYTNEIGNFFQDINIVIANISETNRKDLFLQELKPTHLGIYGIYNLLKETSSDNVLCILTEFYGGFGDIRLEMADLLRKYLNKNNIDIVPVDVGIICFIRDNTFLCSSCKKKVDKTRRSIIRIGAKSKKLYCLCENCALK